MTKDILSFYEREHGYMSLLLREFGERNPRLAASLGIVEGESSDPNTLRFIEATVMVGARISQQLEDSYPQFTGALLDLNYAQHTRPAPSTAIARFDQSERDARAMTAVATIPCGTYMQTCGQRDGGYRFRSIYPVTIAPVAIAHARYVPYCSVPSTSRPPMTATGTIAITFDSRSASATLPALGLTALRVFLDGDPALRATLRDVLLTQVVAAYIEEDSSPTWRALDTIPLASAGFDEDEALLPADARAHPAYRLLTEYFVCPEKFNFIDLDMARICHGLPAATRSLTLHLAITGVAHDSGTARLLSALSSNNLQLSCTPIVNLFKRAAVPIDLTHAKTEYPLLASVEQAATFDIHSVTSVHVVRDTAKGSTITEFHPYYSLRHGQAGRKGHYWSIRRDSVLAQTSPGHETLIALTDIDLDPLALETATISIDLLCTNRDLPSTLQPGQPDGELKLERASGAFIVKLLRKPSPSYRIAPEAHWRLISLLALNCRSLVQQDVRGFMELLQLHNLPQSPVQQRQIEAICALSFKRARCWMDDEQGGARVNGIEIHLTLDLEAFVGNSIHAFVQVLDHFFGLYAELNTFTQLCVFAKSTEKELIRCAPRSGYATLT